MGKLLSVTDIATKYDVSRHRVWNWMRRTSSFPKPVQYISNDTMPIFDSEQVDKFMKLHLNCTKDKAEG
jgi:predicted DNA-binding transcriptional regulator AlpA